MKFTSNSVTVTYNYKVSHIDNKKKSVTTYQNT